VEWVILESVKKERFQWENLNRIPEEVYLKVLALKGLMTAVEWIRLDDLERYALFRLSQEKYSASQFAQALEEFLGFSIPKPAKAAGAS
jgi:hypothetical protein